jgi:hypothetical protein
MLRHVMTLSAFVVGRHLDTAAHSNQAHLTLTNRLFTPTQHTQPDNNRHFVCIAHHFDCTLRRSNRHCLRDFALVSDRLRGALRPHDSPQHLHHLVVTLLLHTTLHRKLIVNTISNTFYTPPFNRLLMSILAIFTPISCLVPILRNAF